METAKKSSSTCGKHIPCKLMSALKVELMVIDHCDRQQIDFLPQPDEDDNFRINSSDDSLGDWS